MKKKKTIRKLLDEQDNDYSFLEPFVDSSPIKTSIIAPIYNDKKIFQKAIKLISKNKIINKFPEKFEYILIDDGSEEDIKLILDKVNLPCKVKYFKFKKNKGRSIARNKGIELSSNELLFFFDADFVPGNNYFSEMWKIHNNSKKIVSLGIISKIFYSNISQDLNKLKYKRTDFRYCKDFKKKIFGEKKIFFNKRNKLV